jgi:hypothetical protein
MKMCIFVLCDFRRAGVAYVETDPAEADATTIIQNPLHGQYVRPLQVLALMRVKAGRDTCQRPSPLRSGMSLEYEGRELTSGTLASSDHIGRALQPTLPLW